MLGCRAIWDRGWASRNGGGSGCEDGRDGAGGGSWEEPCVGVEGIKDPGELVDVPDELEFVGGTLVGVGDTDGVTETPEPVPEGLLGVRV